jgi:hypothetical protein
MSQSLPLVDRFKEMRGMLDTLLVQGGTAVDKKLADLFRETLIETQTAATELPDVVLTDPRQPLHQCIGIGDQRLDNVNNNIQQAMINLGAALKDQPAHQVQFVRAAFEAAKVRGANEIFVIGYNFGMADGMQMQNVAENKAEVARQSGVILADEPKGKDGVKIVN